MSIYRGRTVDELIPQIQQELGSDAIIVRRREGLTGGVLGFFQHPYVEIEAMAGTARVDVYDEEEAVEPPAPLAPPPVAAPAQPPPCPPPVPVQQPAPPAPPFFTRQPASTSAGGSAYVTAHLAALARAERSQIAQPPLVPERPRQPAVDFQELIPRDIPRPYSSTSRPAFVPEPPLPAPRAPAPRAPAPVPASETPPRTFERRTVAPGSHARARAGVEKSLRRYGVGEEFAGELIDAAAAHVLPLAPRAGLAQAVRLTLAQRIPVAPLLPAKGATVALIGAGGAGKTTSCAALLGAYRASGTLPARCATLSRVDDHGELQMILSPKIMNAIARQRAARVARAAQSQGGRPGGDRHAAQLARGPRGHPRAGGVAGRAGARARARRAARHARRGRRGAAARGARAAGARTRSC